MDADSRRPFVIGLRMEDAERLFTDAGERLFPVLTKPPVRRSDEAPSEVEEGVMRVVRQRLLPDGSIELVVARQTASLET